MSDSSQENIASKRVSDLHHSGVEFILIQHIDSLDMEQGLPALMKLDAFLKLKIALEALPEYVPPELVATVNEQRFAALKFVVDRVLAQVKRKSQPTKSEHMH